VIPRSAITLAAHRAISARIKSDIGEESTCLDGCRARLSIARQHSDGCPVAGYEERRDAALLDVMARLLGALLDGRKA